MSTRAHHLNQARREGRNNRFGESRHTSPAMRRAFASAALRERVRLWVARCGVGFCESLLRGNGWDLEVARGCFTEDFGSLREWPTVIRFMRARVAREVKAS